LLKQIMDVVGAVTLLCPVVLFGEQFGAFEPRRKAYFYHFTYRSKKNNVWPDWFGVGHSSELFYVFGKPLKYREQFDDIDRALSNDVIRIWTTFAKTGVPPLPSNVIGKQWPLYNQSHPNHVIINPLKASIKHDAPKDGICNKWRLSVEL
ncbi:acetylcholinesterase-like protein, partial [Leptotrombidium deliense]